MVWLQKGDKFLPDVSKTELKSLYKKEKNAKAKLRLLATIQRKEGKTLEDISWSIKKPKMTVSDWLRRFENGSLERLYDKKQPGKPCKLQNKELDKLKKILSESPEKQKIPFKIWTTNLVQYLILVKFKVEYKVRQIRNLIKNLGFVLKVPRQKNKKASTKAQEEFKKNLKQKYKIILNVDLRSSVLTKLTS